MAEKEKLPQIYGIPDMSYYMLFPLNYFARERGSRRAYVAHKRKEIWPVYVWLVPGIVLLSATTSLNWLGLGALFGLEAFMLAGAATVYLRLRPNQLVEVWLNLWLSMCTLALGVALASFLFAATFSPDSDWS